MSIINDMRIIAGLVPVSESLDDPTDVKYRDVTLALGNRDAFSDNDEAHYTIVVTDLQIDKLLDKRGQHTGTVVCDVHVEVFVYINEEDRHNRYQSRYVSTTIGSVKTLNHRPAVSSGVKSEVDQRAKELVTKSDLGAEVRARAEEQYDADMGFM